MARTFLGIDFGRGHSAGRIDPYPLPDVPAEAPSSPYPREKLEAWEVYAPSFGPADIAAEQAQEQATAYFSALPAEIGGFPVTRKGEVTDDYGNFLFSIPAQAVREGWSLERLTAWIEAQEIFTE